jgi:hypothetical protein
VEIFRVFLEGYFLGFSSVEIFRIFSQFRVLGFFSIEIFRVFLDGLIGSRSSLYR